MLDAADADAKPKQLTSGKWEITGAELSRDASRFYITSTEAHPGERQLYSLSLDGGARTRITTMTGSNESEISPDDGMLGIVYSYSNKPPEVYLMPNQPGAQASRVTTTPTAEWRSFKWIDPKIITYKARDGVDVYARLFTPEMIGARRDLARPGVVFVHGAGYAQNAHKYWASYFREYMFHNLLASRGYVVLDVDYRASSGYGRDWRTAIYRHMGGKDLEDIVDGAKYLASQEKVDPKRIGVYGGSYGGFITLMAMFTTPDVFAAGAALRPVTDWAHYNHGYTSNILNLPQKDAEAYRKSSPIYFVEGLKGALLICHGMVDTNVLFQDSVRLVQRLVELGKENWEFAPYPVENHGFTEETSWADEYRRILKLFEDNLRVKSGKATN
jgi:dipeptidyl aminopeptidase/acylaminoacyl peptidase